MKKGIIGAIVCVLVLIALTTAYLKKDAVMSFLGFETPEQVQEETSFEEPVPTIQDFIVMREEMKETRRIDEVFLTIPEVVLIDILMQHGTCLSIKDVVYIYESNNTIYNKVLSGARAQQYRDSLARDSI